MFEMETIRDSGGKETKVSWWLVCEEVVSLDRRMMKVLDTAKPPLQNCQNVMPTAEALHCIIVGT